MANQKVTAEMREQMIQLFQLGYSYREIAKKIGSISYTTVGEVLRRIPEIDTNQELTEAATQARLRRLAAKRMDLIEKCMEDIDALRERIWGEYELIVSGPEGYDRVLLDEPPLPEQSRAIAAIAQLNSMVSKLKEETYNPAESEAKNVLSTLISGIKEIAGEMKAGEGAGADPNDFDSDYNIHTDPDIWGTNTAEDDGDDT